MANSIVSLFPNSDLRCSHLGLTLAARKAGKNPDTLDQGSFILFLNRAQSAMKLLTANNVVVHFKSPRGRIELRTIQYLPRCFNAGRFDYSKALGIVLDKQLIKKRKS